MTDPNAIYRGALALARDGSTPVASDLLTRIAAAQSSGELRDLVAQLPVPTPPPSTLRIIDLAEARDVTDVGVGVITRHVQFEPDYIEDLAAQPDPMTVIGRTVRQWWEDGDAGDPDGLVARIGAALEGATR